MTDRHLNNTQVITPELSLTENLKIISRALDLGLRRDDIRYIDSQIIINGNISSISHPFAMLGNVFVEVTEVEGNNYILRVGRSSLSSYTIAKGDNGKPVLTIRSRLDENDLDWSTEPAPHTLIRSDKSPRELISKVDKFFSEIAALQEVSTSEEICKMFRAVFEAELPILVELGLHKEPFRYLYRETISRVSTNDPLRSLLIHELCDADMQYDPSVKAEPEYESGPALSNLAGKKLPYLSIRGNDGVKIFKLEDGSEIALRAGDYILDFDGFTHTVTYLGPNNPTISTPRAPGVGYSTAQEFHTPVLNIENLSIRSSLLGLLNRVESGKTDENVALIKQFVIEVQQNLIRYVKANLADGGEDQEAVASKTKEIIDSWAEANLPQVKEFLVSLAQKLKITNLRFSAWSGPQGTGKGTNVKAISSIISTVASLVDDGTIPINDKGVETFVSRYGGSTAEIITGTGGMFNKPTGEYAEVFASMAELTGAIARSGQLVGDSFTSIFTELMVALRIASGAQTIQLDLWPRSEGQQRHCQEMIDSLNGQNISSAIEMLDLRLLSDDVIARIKLNRQGYIQASKNLAVGIKAAMATDEFIRLQKLAKESSNVAQRLTLENDAATLVLAKFTPNSSESPEFSDLLSELKESMIRMSMRAKKAVDAGGTPREDENPITCLTRLASYYGSTAPAQLANEQVEIVSTLNSPDAVAQQIFDVVVTQSGLGQGAQIQQGVLNKMREVIGLAALTVVNLNQLDPENIKQYIKHLLLQINLAVAES